MLKGTKKKIKVKSNYHRKASFQNTKKRTKEEWKHGEIRQMHLANKGSKYLYIYQRFPWTSIM